MVTASIRLLGQVEAWPEATGCRSPAAHDPGNAGVTGRTHHWHPELIAAVWDEQPPQTAWREVQNGISQLRAVLNEHGAADLLGSEPAGYRLRGASEVVDVSRFRTAVSRARACRRRPTDAARAFREALALWRGPALDGLTGAIIGRHAESLDEERLCALEECVEQELLGDHADPLVAELTDLVAHHPLRERFAAALMHALYRSGRQADALRAYQRIAATPSESLDVDPIPGHPAQ